MIRTPFQLGASRPNRPISCGFPFKTPRFNKKQPPIQRAIMTGLLSGIIYLYPATRRLQGGFQPTVDGRNPAPPQRPWKDDLPVNTNKQWFPSGAKWISSIHSMGPECPPPPLEASLDAGERVVCARLRVTRNLSKLRMPPACCADERRAVEARLAGGPGGCHPLWRRFRGKRPIGVLFWLVCLRNKEGPGLDFETTLHKALADQTKGLMASFQSMLQPGKRSNPSGKRPIPLDEDDTMDG